MILLVLLSIFHTLDSHSNSFVSTVWPNDFTSLTVNLPHSWLSTLTHVYLLPDQMMLLVLLLIFPTHDSHSNSFVSTLWPTDFTSLTVNLPDLWLPLICIYCLMILLVLLLIFPTFDYHSNSCVSTVWPNDFTSLTVNFPHFRLSL